MHDHILDPLIPNLTTTLQTIKQQIRSLLREKS